MSSNYMWNADSRSVRKLLKQIGLTPKQRRLFLRAAREESGRFLKIINPNAAYILAAVLLGIFVIPFPAMMLAPYVPAFGRPAAVILLIAAYCTIIWWHFDRWESPKIKPALMRLLYAQGFRFCRSCYYDLRRLGHNVEECPECGTYISRRIESEREEPPVLEHPDRPTSQVHTIVRGGRVPLSAVETAMIRARSRYAHTDLYIDRVLPMVTIILLLVACVISGILAAVLQIPQDERWSYILFPPVFVVVAAAAALTILQHNRSIRAARIELRRDGYEVCVKCGQYLEGLRESAVHCPKCNAPRKPMPQSAPREN